MDLLNEKQIITKIDSGYILNENFKSDTKKINLISNIKPKKKNKCKIKNENIYDHNDLIRCFIIKSLKGTNSEEINEKDIFLYVKKKLESKFKINEEEFKLNLNKLIDMEYILKKEDFYFYN